MEGVLIAVVIILCIIGVMIIAALNDKNKSHHDGIYYSGQDYTHDGGSGGANYRHSHSESGDWGGREGSHSHSDGDGGGE